MQTVAENDYDIGQLLEQHPAIKAEMVSMKDTIHGLKQYILQLEEFTRHGRQKQFGTSSEQMESQHPKLFDEAETASRVDEAPEAEAVTDELSESESKPARKPRKAFRIPPELPRVEIVHDLPEA